MKIIKNDKKNFKIFLKGGGGFVRLLKINVGLFWIFGWWLLCINVKLNVCISVVFWVKSFKNWWNWEFYVIDR